MKIALLIAIALTELIFCQEEAAIEENGPTVNTGSGPIMGIKAEDHFEFLGIPYAEAPVGKLRFMPPEPVRPWTETLEATSNGPECPQVPNPFLPGTDDMSEDCLTLNIFTRNLDNYNPKAVMLWIHGGGFTIGSKNSYRMPRLLEEDVVYVAINYRLHALGFLSFGNDLVSGNMGLRDQHLAIQWVRANIHLFGGDPNKITIFGESAGGMSVQAQVLSPLNSGLLHGAIAQSGSILFLNIQPRGSEKKSARNLAEAVGCPTTLGMETLVCLQNTDFDFVTEAEKISDPTETNYDLSAESKFWFWPVIDSYASTPFLAMDPLEALMTGQFNRIPYMSGTNTYEGALLVGAYALIGVTGSDTINIIKPNPNVGLYMHYGQPEVLTQVAKDFYNHPEGDSRVEQETPALNFFTDIVFTSYDQKSVELMSGHVRNVYNYYLSQKTENSVIGAAFNLSSDFTPLHGDDIVFLSLPEMDSINADEVSTAEAMTKYWANFAKYGTPSPVIGDKADTSGLPAWYPVDGDEKVTSSNYTEI